MTWYESAAHAESSTAPFAAGFDVPETLGKDDVCHECGDDHCRPWCSRHQPAPPLDVLVASLRELQRATREAS